MVNVKKCKHVHAPKYNMNVPYGISLCIEYNIKILTLGNRIRRKSCICFVFDFNPSEADATSKAAASCRLRAKNKYILKMESK